MFMGSYQALESCSRAGPAANGRLWPCGWALARAWGHPITRCDGYYPRGVAGGGPPEGLFRNGDGRRDGATNCRIMATSLQIA